MQLDSAGLNAAVRPPEAPFGRNEVWNAGNFHFSAEKAKKTGKLAEKRPKMAPKGRAGPFRADFSPFFRPGAAARAFFLSHHHR